MRFAHGNHGDLRKKLGRQMREALRVKSAGAGLGEEISTEHEVSICQFDRGSDMAGVAMLGLDRSKERGLVWGQDDGEILCGLVADRLGDEVGECHIAAARSVMRVDTRVSRAARSRDSPME